MVKMANASRDSDSEDDTLTSDCSESSGDESSEQDKEDTNDTASYRSLAFSVRKNRSTAIVKSKKSKKRVRFKPGDSLVLIYIIPNREMLGLKSDSEDSDYGDSDDDSDDEEDDDDDDDDEDDDEDDDDDDDDDSDDDENGNSKTSKTKAVKPKPFAKLIAVKQVNRRKIPDLRNNFKKTQEQPKPFNLDLSSSQSGSKRKQRLKPSKKEKKEMPKPTKKDTGAFNNSKMKQSKSKKNKPSAIKVDFNKTTKSRRNRSRLLEIRATVESINKNQETSESAPKVVYRHDMKPSVIDVNGSLNSSKLLTNRTRLQPTSFSITKSRPESGRPKSANGLPERRTQFSQFMSGNYDSLSSVLPSSYVNLTPIRNNTAEETIKRLDPESMNISGKRNYAWQVANGTISSQSLRTPSILPFLDSLQNSVTENNTIKLPT